MSISALPTKPQQRSGSPLDARVYLIGHPKVGKSTIASQWAPQTTLILDTEHGTRLLDGEHFVQEIGDYKTLDDAVSLIVKGNHPFKTIVIDTADQLWKLVDEHVAKAKGHAAAALIDYGKGTAEAEGLFRRQVGRLLDTQYGIWFLGHADDVEIEKQTRFVPKLDRRVRTYVQGACDFIFFAEAMGARRVIHTQPSARYEAGSRVLLPEPLPLDARAIYQAMDTGLNGESNGRKTR